MSVAVAAASIAERRHHPQSPSNWPKWVQCAGYERTPPDADALARMERGTRVHAMLEAAITGEPVKDDLPDAVDCWEEADWAHGEIMRAAPRNLRVEILLTMPSFFGYADAVADGHVWDLKTGYIDPHYRAQMAGYALAIMDAEMVDSLTLHLLYSTLRMHEEWTITYAEARQLADGVLAARRAAVDRQEGLTTCELCSGCARRTTCPAHSTISAPALEVAVEVMPPGELSTVCFPAVLDKSLIGVDVNHSALFLYSYKALEDLSKIADPHVRQALNDGKSVPGFKQGNYTSPAYVEAADVLRFSREIGSDNIIKQYGNMSEKDFKALWNQQCPDEEFPATVVHKGTEGKRMLRDKPAKAKTTKPKAIKAKA